MIRPFLFLAILFFISCKYPYNASDTFKERAVLSIDEMPHTKNSLEWWYFTGHLKDSLKDKTLGVEYVIFHFNPTNIKGGWMINMAVSDPEQQNFYYDHAYFQKKKHEFEVFPLNFNWKKKGIRSSLKGKEGEYLIDAKMKEHAVSYSLRTKPIKEVVLHDGVGYEEYGKYAKAGYYTYPRLATNGTVALDQDTFAVKGELWYDRQWNCSGVWNRKIAWDWFAIQLEETNSELMLYRVYRLDGTDEIFGGTYTNAQNESVYLESEQIQLKEIEHWKSKESGAVYPTHWKVDIPDLELEASIKVLFPEQELGLNFKPFINFYYWEGMSRIEATINDQRVKGKGYVEMTNRFRVKE